MTFLHGLTLLFIGLKLTGEIGWPWVWVMAPLWCPIVLRAVVKTVKDRMR